MAKTKNDNELWDLNLVAPGVITVECEIVTVSEKFIVINRRRSGSSKRQKESVPRSMVIFVEGALSEGESVKIAYRSERAPAARKMTKVRTDGADKVTGFIRGQNEHGVTILINPEYAVFVTSKTTEVEGPQTEAKKKSSKKKSSKDKS